jgi:adenine-specific DNA glycosylase
LSHPWAEVARREQAAADEAKAREAAEQDEFEREVLRLRHDFAKLKLEYELRRFQQKYSPNPPRDDRGRWTDSGAGA